MTDCEHQIFSNSLTIHTPIFPKNYDINTFVKWIFHADPDKHIELTFLEFETEKDFDRIVVEAGDDIEYILSGDTPYKKRIHSWSNIMEVTFQSDHGTNYPGFKAFLSQTDNDCKFIILIP